MGLRKTEPVQCVIVSSNHSLLLLSWCQDWKNGVVRSLAFEHTLVQRATALSISPSCSSVASRADLNYKRLRSFSKLASAFRSGSSKLAPIFLHKKLVKIRLHYAENAATVKEGERERARERERERERKRKREKVGTTLISSTRMQSKVRPLVYLKLLWASKDLVNFLLLGARKEAKMFFSQLLRIKLASPQAA